MDFAKIRPRGGTKAQWEKANPVLAKREIGVQWETTIGVGEVVIKIGDGVTDWINLPEAVKSDITKKIIAALAVVPDDDPDLADGDSLDTLFGKIAKKFKYLKDNKLDKSARYDGTDSTSTELVPTANALRGVNAKADKNASDITTINNNLSKCLQYIHSETDVFDFNDPKTPAGYHRLGAAASYKNAPSGLDGVNFCTVEIVRPTISDTLAMTIYPYKKGINPPVWYKSGGSNEWSTLPWNVYATKSDLNSALIYRGDITGDLNRASKNGITPGYYTVGNSSTISNGPKGIAWCPFIQFYDNFHTQMIIDTTGLFVRKFAGNPAAWIDWAQYSKS